MGIDIIRRGLYTLGDELLSPSPSGGGAGDGPISLRRGLCMYSPILQDWASVEFYPHPLSFTLCVLCDLCGKTNYLRYSSTSHIDATPFPSL
ncbi:hypothetical protein A6A03_02790 [Chloroflexus islandicus]|uniref:Uncharacterized protein n=1 Tax=Chloroflexus islandicus TaxID=1707952 RepID=A0A178MAN9_9CHLR|nr:hypothetical protein A6A03_02790 [Chloroflexus islandicus]